MYRLRLTRREKRKLLRVRWLVLFLALVGVVLVVWLAWVRPMRHAASINNFDECVAAGNPIQETYPEVCLTKDGKRFVNPKQDAAHQAALEGEQEILPPSDPSLLRLDVDEWDVRIPLTMQTFDLTYAYFDLNGEQYLLFTYKRLLQLGVCQGDIGLKLTRTMLQRQPPYTAENPAPIAQAGQFYFYSSHTRPDKLCYDDKNPEQVDLVRQIAGEQTLVQATEGLLSKLTVLPLEE